MSTTAPTPVLRTGTIYLAGDRFVCAEMRCAGQTALYSGRTIDSAALTPIRGRDVIEVASVRPGPLTCECGALVATFSMRDGLRVERVAGHQQYGGRANAQPSPFSGQPRSGGSRID